MQNVVVLLLTLFLGYGVRRLLSQAHGAQLSRWLNHYVIYIALPALVLVYIPRIDPDASIWTPVLSAWGLFLLSSAAVLILGRIARWQRDITGALLFTVPYGNTSFLGVPFTRAFFGEEGLPYTLLYDQLGSFLILSTIGVVVLAFYTSERPTLTGIIRKIITFPAFVALIVAFFLIGVQYPTLIETPLSLLASTLAPVAMIAIGLQLKLRFAPHETRPFLLAMMIKLIVAPALLLALFYLLDLHDLSARVSVFEAGMAPMVSSSTLAILAGLNRQFTASVLGYGIVLSFATLPVVYWLADIVLNG
jgi:predicted permease